MADRVPAYVQGLSYTAQDDRLHIEDVWGIGSEGIVGSDSFRVTAGGGATNMSITVGPGRGVICSDVPYNGSYHVVADANKSIDLGGSSGTEYRRDAVVARVRDSALVTADGDLSFSREVIAGAFVSSTDPPLPSIPDRSILLYEVLINPNTTAPAMIIDRRQLLKPRTFTWQKTVVRPGTTQADKDTWIQVGNAAVDQWPSWVAVGGATCYHEVSITGYAFAASEVQFRAIIGNALDDAKVASDIFNYRVYSPGTYPYYASGEYILTALTTPISQIQVQRVGSRRTALAFEQVQSVSTHRIHVIERPN